jgi:Tol biopolymer transport system component
MKRTIAGLSVLALTAGLLTAAQPAVATAPGCNGQLTFMRQDSADFWQVWVANADLTDQRQLTHGAADSGWPVWSPDGKKLAFDTDRRDASPGGEITVNDVFTMNADGSGVKNLTGSVAFSGDPGWSPDGSLIAFSSNGGDYPARQGIYVMRSDGSHVRRVTILPAGDAGDGAPRFSPDGRRLVFTRYRGDVANSALFIVDLDGHHLRQVTSFAIGAGDADWSPDGKELVFEATPTPQSHGQTDVVRTDGRRLRTLKSDFSADPVWSPDGKQIILLQGDEIDGRMTFGLATMKPNGTKRHFISAAPMDEHQPDMASLSTRHHCR